MTRTGEDGIATPKEALKSEIRSAREELYRDRIMAAAEPVFAEHGFEGARIKAIAERAGLSVGSVYGVFTGKDAVFLAVHEHRSTELFSRMAETIYLDGEPLTVILQGIEETVRFFCERPDYLRMHLQERTAWSMAEQDTEVQSASWQLGIQWIRDAFVSGQASGVFHEGDPESSARILMAILQVKLSEWVQREPRPPLDEVVTSLSLLFRRAFVKGAAG